MNGTAKAYLERQAAETSFGHSQPILREKGWGDAN